MKRLNKVKQSLYLSVVLVSLFSTLQFSVAHALSDTDIQSIYNDTVWYNPDSITCGADLTPGKGAPDGAQFPNLGPSAMANAIDKWVVQKNPDSKLKGLGSTIVASAKNSDVSPFLIVTIANKESSLADPSDFNVINGNNSFGRTATESQPHFTGARLWYKWSSVKASIDYTAPENKNAQGGGDLASYMRNQYGPQLDHDNITALLLLYAPPSENDTAGYITQVQGWVDELVSLTGGTIGNSAVNECAGAVAGDAVKTAVNYSWPDYHQPNYCNEKPSYKQAMGSANAAGQYIGGTCTIGGTWIGVDCGAFVTRVMIDSGADPGYNYGGSLSNGAGNTLQQQKYLDEQVAKGKYNKLSGVTGTGQLQPGDIAINTVHTYMFVGTQPGFNGNSASSSFSEFGTSWRAPMASPAYGFGEFAWYRLVD